MLKCASRAWLEIDLSKVAHNVNEIRKLIPSTTKIMGIVKANAYGHGDVAISKELIKCGIDFFGVSSVSEAISLREAGISESILILGYTPPQHFHYILEYDLIQNFLSLDYAKKANAYCEEHHQKMRGHIKVDTGMSRLGFVMKENDYHLDEVIEVFHMKHLQVEGIFSHFSVSDSLEEDHKAYTAKQIELFERVLHDLRIRNIDYGITHLQNSYGILNYPELHYDYVRPGLLYLGATSDDSIETNTHPNFYPIMQLKANVSMVKTIKENTCVSYGRNYRSSSKKVIATVSIGYADGYPRSVSNQGMKVLIHGKEAEIIGNICMDQMMIDVTNIDHVQEGDVVTLFGADQDAFLPIDVLTRKAHTINNETFCWFSARVPRIYK